MRIHKASGKARNYLKDELDIETYNMESVRIHGAIGKARNYLKDELDIDTENMKSVRRIRKTK